MNLKEVKRYWDIILYKAYANVKGEHQKAFIGCFWWVLEPVIFTASFYLVFAVLLGVRDANFVVFLFLGMVAYGWFSNGVSLAANSLVQHASLMQQVWLPKQLFPLIAVANASWKFVFSLLVLFPLLWWSGVSVTSAYLALPVLLAVQLLVIVGLSLPLAAVIPFFHDGRTVLATVLTAGMWVSGVFFPLERVPVELQGVYLLNPVAALIEGYRAILLNGMLPVWSTLLPGVGMALACGGLGWALLSYVDRRVTKLPV